MAELKHNTILKSWFDYCKKVLSEEWTVTFEEETFNSDGARPPKPYVTLKIISGPRKLALDDNLVNTSGNKFELVGQRGYTLSIKSYGTDYIDGLEDLSTCLDDPDNWEKLKSDADIAIVDRGDVSDISAKLETGFERRATLDIIFNSSNNKLTNIGPIEGVEVSGSIKNEDGTKTVNTNMPIITKE